MARGAKRRCPVLYFFSNVKSYSSIPPKLEKTIRTSRPLFALLALPVLSSNPYRPASPETYITSRRGAEQESEAPQAATPHCSQNDTAALSPSTCVTYSVRSVPAQTRQAHYHRKGNGTKRASSRRVHRDQQKHHAPERGSTAIYSLLLEPRVGNS